MRTPEEILADKDVAQQLAQAWNESQPGPVGGREQGGFVVEESDHLSVVRWPAGETRAILVPPHAGGCLKQGPIVASFHTHPNTGPEFRQEPSPRDVQAMREDADLKASWFVGEFIIADRCLYLLQPDGEVREMGRRIEFLGGHPKGTF